MMAQSISVRTSARSRVSAVRLRRSTRRSVLSAAITLLPVTLTAWAQTDIADLNDSARQQAEYNAAAPKTIIELQPFRRTTAVAINDATGRVGTATLINLNPAVNAWYVLALHWTDPAESRSYHIENPIPQMQELSLHTTARGIGIAEGGTMLCEPWSIEGDALQTAKDTGLPYAPLCGGRLYLRNSVPGTYTHIERVTQFLRDHVWGGDRIVAFVRDEAFRDAYAEIGADQAVTSRPARPAAGPEEAQVQFEDTQIAVFPEHLGIDLGSAKDLMLGLWYPLDASPGEFLSVMRPGAVPQSILGSFRGTVNALDATEARGLDYLVAFDLQQFELHFALGTDHPRLDWSERVVDQQRDPSLRGPDGIANSAPLARTGMVSPALTAEIAATFAGGFKREHGAFRYGTLALENSGTHYGFMEQGVIFSKLQPGLATVYRTVDGHVGMKTWTLGDDVLQPHLADARQNGVPLIEYNPQGDVSRPGPLVNQWGPGNWSGSNESQLRTVRAGLCLQQTASRSWLIFGYFSTATPSAMARVFQAYGCRYAMQLDINALEHTYLALYVHKQGRVEVQHLVQGMGDVDRKGGEQLSPRFLGFPDDRDFFYLRRTESK